MNLEDMEKATIENTINTEKLILVANQTTTDVDKLVKHMENMLPVHTDIANLKKLLFSSVAVGILYCAWCTLYVFETHEKVSNHNIASVKREEYINNELKSLKEKIDHNKNQVTYLKGSKQNKKRS